MVATMTLAKGHLEKWQSKRRCLLARFYGRDGEDFYPRALILRMGLNRKDLSEATTEKRVDAKTNQHQPVVIPLSMGDNLLCVAQQLEMAKVMWYRLQENYVGRTATNKLTLINSLLNMRYSREQNMGSFIAIGESQFARLASMDT